ncbi:MAG: hypothetical protein A2677_01420 [Candidatus Komeilibacteria bacterium RIFCSPHIGHO2_01_FULL_52_14]|uniref:DUF559 domain-containing protein n=1 Tax=Candidatus Komeilibacteria bacterium RIFCSPHIGHO2_01_FULL_52_14 TaxID=1798549 RepID=A0A1G2BM97_9BACT|nr:MAG: hypothetical protein A2677_01420 [Candidatus Komeilibacteria bacterium RIFCSPHIGHO2_01_FULL_52_14]
MQKNSPKPTKEVTSLVKALENKGIKVECEYWDGHKHIDIGILSAKIYIEIDGLQHYTNADQIKRDFKRDHFSDGDDFRTIHIPNELIKEHLEKIADAISQVVVERQWDKNIN